MEEKNRHKNDVETAHTNNMLHERPEQIKVETAPHHHYTPIRVLEL